jgi:hypothetical protein
MKYEDLMSEASALRQRADERERAAHELRRAEALRTHAQQMMTEADAIEAPLRAAHEATTATAPASPTTDAAKLVRDQWAGAVPQIH